MRFFLSFVSSLVELVTFFARWLFIVTAPVLLITTAAYYQDGKSCLEPLVSLALVTGMFAGTHWLALQIDEIQPHDIRNRAKEFGVTASQTSNEAEFWNSSLGEQGWRQAKVTAEEASRRNQGRAEAWRQSNPWGGYNPYD